MIPTVVETFLKFFGSPSWSFYLQNYFIFGLFHWDTRNHYHLKCHPYQFEGSSEKQWSPVFNQNRRQKEMNPRSHLHETRLQPNLATIPCLQWSALVWLFLVKFSCQRIFHPPTPHLPTFHMYHTPKSRPLPFHTMTVNVVNVAFSLASGLPALAPLLRSLILILRLIFLKQSSHFMFINFSCFFITHRI